jgi:type IV secretory pathway TrbD component
MATLGAPPHVIGHVLNHAPAESLGQIGAVYRRHDYMYETREVLAAWAVEVGRTTSVMNALGPADREHLLLQARSSP